MQINVSAFSKVRITCIEINGALNHCFLPNPSHSIKNSLPLSPISNLQKLFGLEYLNLESNALKVDTPIMYIPVIAWWSNNGPSLLPYLNTKIRVPVSRGRKPNDKAWLLFCKIRKILIQEFYH